MIQGSRSQPSDPGRRAISTPSVVRAMTSGGHSSPIVMIEPGASVRRRPSSPSKRSIPNTTIVSSVLFSTTRHPSSRIAEATQHSNKNDYCDEDGDQKQRSGEPEPSPIPSRRVAGAHITDGIATTSPPRAAKDARTMRRVPIAPLDAVRRSPPLLTAPAESGRAPKA